MPKALDWADCFGNSLQWSLSWSSNWPLLLQLHDHRTRCGTWRRFRPWVAVIMSISSPITNETLKNNYELLVSHFYRGKKIFNWGWVSPY